MKAIRLFDEPFDLGVIENALRDDSFISLAYMMLGFEHNWRAGLEQTSRLLTAFEESERDPKPIYGMVSVLIRRAETFDDTGKFLEELVETMGFLPGTKYMEEIKMAHLHKIDPHAWQRTKNRLWVENYRAQMKAMRSPLEHRV